MNTIDKKIFPRLKIIAKKYDFDQIDKENICIYKNSESTIDSISCTIRYMRGEYNGAFFYTKFYENIEKHLKPYYNELGIYSEKIHSTIFFGHRYKEISITVHLNDIFQIPIEDTPEGIAAFCDLLEYNIVEKILPLAEKFNDIKYLERKIRNSLKGYTEFSEQTLEKDLLLYLNRQDFRFRLPIIAKLAQVEDYDYVKEKIIKEMERIVNIDNKYQYMLDVMNKLLIDLE